MRSKEEATRPAQIADLISTAVLRRHLETMQRLSIAYDFLPPESEIISRILWKAARTLMLGPGCAVSGRPRARNRGVSVTPSWQRSGK